jgi:hypothetical protein
MLEGFPKAITADEMLQAILNPYIKAQQGISLQVFRLPVPASKEFSRVLPYPRKGPASPEKG